MEEALSQVSIGGRSEQKLMEEFSNVVDRIRISDELDVLRIKEVSEMDAESRMNLAQEKLLRKRTLAKVTRET